MVRGWVEACACGAAHAKPFAPLRRRRVWPAPANPNAPPPPAYRSARARPYCFGFHPFSFRHDRRSRLLLVQGPVAATTPSLVLGTVRRRCRFASLSLSIRAPGVRAGRDIARYCRSAPTTRPITTASVFFDDRLYWFSYASLFNAIASSSSTT